MFAVDMRRGLLQGFVDAADEIVDTHFCGVDNEVILKGTEGVQVPKISVVFNSPQAPPIKKPAQSTTPPVGIGPGYISAAFATARTATLASVTPKMPERRFFW
jgi:hypothetical protein